MVAQLMPAPHPILAAILILGVFGAVYFGMVLFLDVPHARAMIVGRLRARLGGRRP